VQLVMGLLTSRHPREQRVSLEAFHVDSNGRTEVRTKRQKIDACLYTRVLVLPPADAPGTMLARRRRLLLPQRKERRRGQRQEN
jgi:hypothetical protein